MSLKRIFVKWTFLHMKIYFRKKRKNHALSRDFCIKTDIHSFIKHPDLTHKLIFTIEVIFCGLKSSIFGFQNKFEDWVDWVIMTRGIKINFRVKSTQLLMFQWIKCFFYHHLTLLLSFCEWEGSIFFYSCC